MIQTLLDQQYVTVAPQGGLELSKTVSPFQLFTLIGPNQGLGFPIGYGDFQIKTYDGSYLIAAEGGGQTSNAFLTDQPPNPLFSNFWIVKCGDLGDGYRYAIKAVVPGEVGNFLTAHKGGGQTQNSIIAYPKNGLTSDGIFTLRQLPLDEATPPFTFGYALQTSNGFNYVTAVDGGGLAGGDNLHTDATRVDLTLPGYPDVWENFHIVDQLDGTYAIQTMSGYYLAVASAQPSSGTGISTDISSPDLAPEIGYTAKFEFIMIPNQLGDVDTETV